MSENPMTVLQVNTSDVGGGAEKIVMDLNARYLKLGIDSWVAVGKKHSDSSRVIEIPNETSRGAWARGLEMRAAKMERAGGTARKTLSRALLLAAEPGRYRRILRGVEDFEYPGTSRILSLPPRLPDVLHLHNLHGYYFDIRMLPRLSATQPTVITLHDAWLITGHCAHPFDCPRWQTGCGECPDPGMYVPIRRDGSAESWRIKHEAVRTSGASLATPSHWLMNLVESSGLVGEGALTRVIPNGVDTSVFSPGEKDAARAELDLPADRPIVLFAARNAADSPFKDFATLVAALPQVSAKLEAPPLFVALGAEKDADVVADSEVRAVPFETDARRLAAWYRAADVYVHPTRAESFGLTVAEAMACGTPVVASRVGGIPEVIAEGESGLLVDVGDASQLAASIVSLLQDAARRDALGRAAAQRIQGHFTIERQADAYLEFYAELADAHAHT